MILLVYFPPVVLLELPSTLMLRILWPSTWLSILVSLSGILVTCQGVVKTYGSLAAVHCLLGICQSGMLPACGYIMSFYYQRHELAWRYSIWYVAGMLAIAFGGFLAYAIAKMHGIGGYNGW